MLLAQSLTEQGQGSNAALQAECRGAAEEALAAYSALQAAAEGAHCPARTPISIPSMEVVCNNILDVHPVALLRLTNCEGAHIGSSHSFSGSMLAASWRAGTVTPALRGEVVFECIALSHGPQVAASSRRPGQGAQPAVPAAPAAAARCGFAVHARDGGCYHCPQEVSCFATSVCAPEPHPASHNSLHEHTD